MLLPCRAQQDLLDLAVRMCRGFAQILRHRWWTAALKIVQAGLAPLFLEFAHHPAEEFPLGRRLRMRDRFAVQPIDVAQFRLVPDPADLTDAELEIGIFG